MTAGHHHHHHAPQSHHAGPSLHDGGLWLHHLWAHLAGYAPAAIVTVIVVGGLFLLFKGGGSEPAMETGGYRELPPARLPAPAPARPPARSWPSPPPARASRGRGMVLAFGASLAVAGFALAKIAGGTRTVIATAPRPVITVRPVITHAPVPVVHQAAHVAASHPGLSGGQIVFIVAIVAVVVLGLNSILRFDRRSR